MVQHCNLLRDPRALLGNIAWLIVLAMPAGLGISVYPPKPDLHQEGADRASSLSHEDWDLLWGLPAMVRCGMGSSSCMSFTAGSGAYSCINFALIPQLLEISSWRGRGKPHGEQAVKGAVCPSLWARSLLVFRCK